MKRPRIFWPGTRVVIYGKSHGSVRSIYIDPSGEVVYEVDVDAATSGCKSGDEPIGCICSAPAGDLRIKREVPHGRA